MTNPVANHPRRRGTCPGVLAPMRVGDGFLLRVRVPAGMLPAEQLTASLDDIAASLAQRKPVAIHSDTEEDLAKRLEQVPEELEDPQRLVQTQLALICRELAPLRSLAAHLLKKEIGAEQEAAA